MANQGHHKEEDKEEEEEEHPELQGMKGEDQSDPCTEMTGEATLLSLLDHCLKLS